MEISRPKSYQTYCDDQAIRTAVDHLLAASSNGSNDALNLPEDIKWDDMLAFHRALLSAHQIRSEYAIYLIDLWNTVWEPTLVVSNIGLKPMTVKECEKLTTCALDTYSTWKNQEFYRSYYVADSSFTLALGTADYHEGPNLWFSCWDEDNTSIEFESNEHWSHQEQDNEGWFRTRDNFVIVQENGGLDTARLKEAAIEILKAVSSQLDS